MFSFCVEEQKGLAYHLEGLRAPLVVRLPQFGNHCFRAGINYVVTTTDLMFRKLLIFDGLTNFMLKWIWCGLEGNCEDFIGMFK